MFRKLISNIAFSPALITQVSFYANRLRREEVTRRLTIGFTILAMIVQSMALLSPPESANASNEQDLIHGGVRSLDDILNHYDHNTDDIRDIYTTAGLTRAEVAAAQPATISSKDELFILNRHGQIGSRQGELTLSYKRSAGGTGVRYVSPLQQLSPDSPAANYQVWTGTSAKLGWFAIIKPSASLATKQPLAAAKNTKSGPISYSLSAINVSQGSVDATRQAAKPFDKIRYTSTALNTTGKTSDADLTVHIGDILEYSTLVDMGGGLYDPTSKTITWPLGHLLGHEAQERTFVVQVMSEIPATAAGLSNPSSYDCVMSATYGDLARIPVNCPPTKQLEGFLASLPAANLALNFGLASLILAVVTFYYFRTRQLKKEIRLIRHNLNTGII